MKAIDRETLISELQSQDNGTGVFTRKQIIETASGLGFGFPAWLVNGMPEVKVDRGVYNLTSMFGGSVAEAQPIAQSQQAPLAVVETQAPRTLVQAKLAVEVDDLIPGKDATFVPFGFYKDLKTVLSTSMFYPIFISGLSGNGKTTMVEQVCANLKREAIRVNISIETDEDDLIGGNTLVDGNVVYREGPVLTAMKRGAVLILDEVDRGSNKLMCLQSVLEGKGYLIKKTGEWVSPKEGFTILATANTKGQGSDDGKFIGTQIMNEAMLERFAITMQQEYPPVKTEKSILAKEMELTGAVDEDFVEKLVDWADIIRKTYYEGGIDDVVTTRRLVHIVNAWKMFGDRMKSIQLCISRFDEETRDSFLDLYTKVDAGVSMGDDDYENPIDSNEV